MKELIQSIKPALISLLVFTVMCGVLYPLAIGGAARVIPAPEPSELVGRSFAEPRYFWSRPTAVEGYKAMTSSGTNAGPSGFVGKGVLGPNPALADAVKARIQALRDADPGNTTAKVPVDLVTASASGLDPDISPAAAYYQVARVARARSLTEAHVRSLVDAAIEERTFGILGERRVNVVRLNRALDAGK